MKSSTIGRIVHCPIDGVFEVTLLAEKMLLNRGLKARKRALLWAHVLAGPGGRPLINLAAAGASDS
jgi:hypothetical protein